MDLDIDGPLSEEELDELENFLMSDVTPEDCMDISMLDGFLTALAIGPTTILPSQWLPVVWGGDVAWETPDQFQRITSLIFRYSNDLTLYLQDDPDEFEPLLYENDFEGKTVQVLDEWCSGFVQGMTLDEAAWQPFLDSEEGEELLYPILLYGTEVGWDELKQNPEVAERHAEFAQSLGDAVLAIHAHWLPLRKEASTFRREDPKVGRNDECPCGSGKKYKKCCGSPERLH